MRISLDWVKRLLGVDELGHEPEELARLLTMHLAEIDAVEATGPSLEGVVVGRVLSCQQHPNADRLRVTTVDVGSEQPLPIVCGADNVAAGQLVPVAPVGTVLQVRTAEGGVEALKVKKGKLRGEPSHGMICAEDELGLGTDHSGILVLDDDHPPGTPLDRVIATGDHVLVIDNHNINHRPDLWGHLGWAREIAAICDLPPPAEPDLDWEDTGDGFRVIIRNDDCSAYSGAVVGGLHNGASPQWMQDLLLAVGSRPHGLLVDVTNFVMLELGEPMHAFDRRQIAGDELIVRGAAAGEVITTLDETTVDLQPGDLLIADDQRSLALAGIMGGKDSMVRDDTTEVVLEAACFAPARIRATRIRTGVASESSNRFEKGLYPLLTRAAINRAIALLRAICPELTVSVRFSAGAGLASACCAETTVAYQSEQLRRLTGFDLPAATQHELLARIGFTPTGDGLRVPWWRSKDITGAHDLVEEVARLHGYDAIAPCVPCLPAAAPTPNRLRNAEHRARDVLSALGWDEVATYGFISEAWCAELGLAADERLIRLPHPLSQDQSVLRIHTLPNLLEAAGRNLRHLAAASVYEIGKRYGRGLGAGTCTDETLVLAGLHADPATDTPFYAARDALLELLAALGYRATVRAQALDATPAGLLPGRCAAITVDGQAVARVGEVDAALRRRAACEPAAAWFELELERLLATLPPPPPQQYRPVSRYQRVDRDFTFVCPEALTFAELEAVVASAARDLLCGIELAAPIYRGEQIPPRHKALSLRVHLQAADRTLSEKELRKTSERIVTAVEKRTAARLRR